MPSQTIGDLLVRIGVNTSGLSTQIGAIEKRFEQLGTRMYFMGGRITQGVTVPIVAAAAAVAKFGIEFDKAMTESLAIMTDVSDTMRTEMEATARAVSETTKFSAEEAAEGYYHLASAGLDAAQAMKALPAVAKFAQAGVMDLAKASEFLTGAQAALGMKSEDAAENMAGMVQIADALTYANNKALGTVKDFAAGLSGKLGPQMRVFNKDVNEAVSLLMALAEQNIKGAPASQQAYIFARDVARFAAKKPDVWAEKGITVFDPKTGNLREYYEIIQDLENAFKDLSDLEKTALWAKLGFQDRSRAATQYFMGMSQKMKEYKEGLITSQGETERVAELQMKAIGNRLAQFWHRIQNELIRIFEEFRPAFETYVFPAFERFVGVLKSVGDAIRDLSPKQKMWLLELAGVAALLGPGVMLLGSWMLLLRAATAPIQLLTSLIKGLTAATLANSVATRTAMGAGLAKGAITNAMMLGATRNAIGVAGGTTMAMQAGIAAVIASSGANAGKVIAQAAANAEKQAVHAAVQAIAAQSANNAARIAQASRDAAQAVMASPAYAALKPAQRTTMMFAARAEAEATEAALIKASRSTLLWTKGLEGLASVLRILAKPIVGLSLLAVDFAVSTVRMTGELKSLWYVVEAVIFPIGILNGLFKGLGVNMETALNPVTAVAEGFKTLWGAVKLVGEGFEWVSTLMGLMGAELADAGKGIEAWGETIGKVIKGKVETAITDAMTLWGRFKRWVTGEEIPEEERVPHMTATGRPLTADKDKGGPLDTVGEFFLIPDLHNKVKYGQLSASDWIKELSEASDLAQMSVSDYADKGRARMEDLNKTVAASTLLWDALRASIQKTRDEGPFMGTPKFGATGASGELYRQAMVASHMSQEDYAEWYRSHDPTYVTRQEKEDNQKRAAQAESDAHAKKVAEWRMQLLGDESERIRVLTEGWAGLTTEQKANAFAIGNQIDGFAQLKDRMPTATFLQNLGDWWSKLIPSARGVQTALDAHMGIKPNMDNVYKLWDVYKEMRKDMTASEMDNPIEKDPAIQAIIQQEELQAQITATIKRYEELEAQRNKTGFGTDPFEGLSSSARDMVMNAEAYRDIWSTFSEKEMADKLGGVGDELTEIAMHVAWDKIPVELQAMIQEFWRLGAAGKLNLDKTGKAAQEAEKSILSLTTKSAAKMTDLADELSIFEAGFGGRDFKGIKKNLEMQARSMRDEWLASVVDWSRLAEGQEKQNKWKQLEAVQAGNKSILAAEERLNLLRLAEAAGFGEKYLRVTAGTAMKEAQGIEKMLKDMGLSEAEIADIMVDIWLEAAKIDDERNATLRKEIEIRKELERQKKVLDNMLAVGGYLADILGNLGFTGVADALSKGLSAGSNIMEGLWTLKDKQADTGDRIAGGVQAFTGGVQAYSAMVDTKGAGSRALIGASSGAMMGATIGNIFPGIGTAIGALVGGIIGAIGGLIMREPKWAQAQSEFKYQTGGVTISEEMGKKIADEAKETWGGDRVSSAIYNLKDIIEDVGGINAGNFLGLLGKLRDAFSMLETGKFTLADTTKVLEENFAAFADFVVKSGGVAEKAFTDLLELNQRFKTSSAEIVKFISQMTQQFATGLVAYMKGVTDAFKFTLPDTKLPVPGQEKTYTLDKLLEQVATAQNNVDDLKEKISDLELTIAGRADKTPTPRQAEELQELRDELALAETNLADLKKLGAEARDKIGPDIERMGLYLVAMFNGAIAKGQDLLTVMTDLGPALDYLNDIIKVTGYEVQNPAVAELLNFQKLIKDNEALVQGLAGLNQMFLALVNTGSMTQEIFDSMSSDAVKGFDDLLGAGFSPEQAMTMIAPMLKNIIKAAEQYGFVIDDNTMKLILQGREMGLIKDDELTTNQILLQGLAAIIEALGGTIPEAWKTMLADMEKSTEEAGRETGRAATDGFDEEVRRYRAPRIRMGYYYEQDGDDPPSPPPPPPPPDPDPTLFPQTPPNPWTPPPDPNPDPDPPTRILGMAEGGIVTEPTLAWIGERNRPEAVIPLDRLFDDRTADTPVQEVHWHVHANDTKSVKEFITQEVIPTMNDELLANRRRARSNMREALGLED